jgi:hypothetical protein
MHCITRASAGEIRPVDARSRLTRRTPDMARFWLPGLGLGLLAGLVLFPGRAAAEYTVTITNETDKDVKIAPGDGHECIQTPNYFEKTVPANDSIRVTAKWNVCTVFPNPFIDICRQDTRHCYTLQQSSGTKHLLISDNGFIIKAD